MGPSPVAEGRIGWLQERQQAGWGPEWRGGTGWGPSLDGRQDTPFDQAQRAQLRASPLQRQERLDSLLALPRLVPSVPTRLTGSGKPQQWLGK